jgi:hypothetical protein
MAKGSSTGNLGTVITKLPGKHTTSPTETYLPRKKELTSRKKLTSPTSGPRDSDPQIVLKLLKLGSLELLRDYIQNPASTIVSNSIRAIETF